MDENSSNALWVASTKKQRFENTEVVETGQFTWSIDDWNALGERELSPQFDCGGYRWQLLLFPHGNPQSMRKGMISLYLNSVGPAGQDETDENKSYHVCCAFALVMWNPECPSSLVTQASHNRFTPRVTDWGYSEFYTIRSAFVRAPNASSPLIAPSKADGKLKVNISVDMDVLADPTGVMWHDFHDYDSKEMTGYTGLVNQGATCYLNSLLQSLYFTKAFRNAVYALPDSSGVSGGLQRVFYRLATSKPAVDTTDLTKAFGWDSADAFTQHDVQELARVLMDRLESKMKGTDVDGFLSKLFVGQMKSYIKCINVPFESSRSEEFWDIQLNVRGMKNVYDSFRDYCTEETLEGDNQYAAGEYGLQDAVKGVIFENLPPVLHLQLKRYDFDWMRELQVKINDRYEFPLELDLSDFVSDKSRLWDYELHGVLVHSGDLDAGHYYALIKPEASTSSEDLDKGWYKFDDDLVTKATVHEVLDENFGGDERSLLRKVTSAYMLVYVRKDSREFVLPSSKDASGPPNDLAQRIDEEQRIEKLRQEAIAERQLYVNLQVLSLESIKHHHGPGILPWSSESKFPPSEYEEPENLKVRVGTTNSSLMDKFEAGSLWLAPSEERVDTRACPRRLQNVPSPREYNVEHLTSWTTNPLVFFGPRLENNHKLVFVKKYEQDKLSVLGYKLIDAGRPLKHELSEFYSIYGPENTSLSVEVTVPNSLHVGSRTDTHIQLPASDVTAYGCGIEHGEIIVVSPKNKDVAEYFADLHSRINLVLIRQVSDEEENEEEKDAAKGETTLSNAEVEEDENTDKIVPISIHDSYDAIVKKVGEALHCAPDRLLLQSLPPRWSRSHVIHSSGDNISDLWNYCDLETVRVLCRVLPVTLHEYENMCEVAVTWFQNGHMGTESTKVVLGRPEESLRIDGLSPQDIVIWVSLYGRKCKELASPTLGMLFQYQNENWDIYAAPLVPQEKRARSTEGSRLAACFHFQNDPGRTHGIPFYFAVVPGEPFSETKSRIFQHLRHDHAADRSLEKIRFAIVNDRSLDTAYITDDSLVLYDALVGSSFLGLDHPARAKNNPHQQAIHID